MAEVICVQGAGGLEQSAPLVPKRAPPPRQPYICTPPQTPLSIPTYLHAQLVCLLAWVDADGRRGCGTGHKRARPALCPGVGARRRGGRCSTASTVGRRAWAWCVTHHCAIPILLIHLGVINGHAPLFQHVDVGEGGVVATLNLGSNTRCIGHADLGLAAWSRGGGGK